MDEELYYIYASMTDTDAIIANYVESLKYEEHVTD